MSGRYDLVVVGMGSAGTVAAQFAAEVLGVKVAAVERDRIGGDCLWTGCVPSKALLASAKVAHTMRTAAAYGVAAVEPQVDSAAVFDRVRAIQRDIEREDDNAERFEAMGVDVRFGAARLVDPTTVEVTAADASLERLEARFVLLCTGSRPVVPPIPGLEDAGFLTSESLWEVDRAPESLISIGGGPIAVELSQAFQRLGTPTTVLQQGDRILPRDEPALVDALVEQLRAEGLAIELGARAERVEVAPDGRKVVHGTIGGQARTWTAHELLLGAGRAPNVEGLGLEGLGVEITRSGVAVDKKERTAVKSVYAVGDLTGGYQFTHAAGFDAARAVRGMFIPGSTSRADVVPWATFTDPELAHAGLTEEEARGEHGDDDVEVFRLDLDHNDRARAEGHTEGAIVIVTHKGRVVGAHALAPSAGELIHELSLAIDRGVKLRDLASVVHVYPTLALGVQQLASQAAYDYARKFRRLVRSAA